MTVARPLAALALVSALTACACGPNASSDAKTAAGAVRAADAAWSKAAQQKNVDAWMAYYTADAVVLPPNGAMIREAAALRTMLGGLLGLRGLQIGWTALGAEAAASGELAYTYGRYDMSYVGDDGKKVEDRGKVLEVWKRQPDGRWLCAVDAWNSDLPAR